MELRCNCIQPSISWLHRICWYFVMPQMLHLVQCICVYDYISDIKEYREIMESSLLDKYHVCVDTFVYIWFLLYREKWAHDFTCTQWRAFNLLDAYDMNRFNLTVHLHTVKSQFTVIVNQSPRLKRDMIWPNCCGTEN